MSSRSSGCKTSKIILLVIYYLTNFDDVIESGFSVFPKTAYQVYAKQFMTS